MFLSIKSKFSEKVQIFRKKNLYVQILEALPVIFDYLFKICDLLTAKS